MGSTIVTPLYRALKALGVKVAFFHMLRAIKSADGKSITSIDLARQATVTAGVFAYEPFADAVKGTWPAQPHFDQLAPDTDRSLPFESYWHDWPVTTTLNVGADFDKVVFNIGPNAHAAVASSLLAASAEWRAAASAVATVQTAALQAWSTQTLDELWGSADAYGGEGAMVAGVDPLMQMSFGDFSYLLEAETATPAKSLMYMCGPRPDTRTAPPPLFTASNYPEQQLADQTAYWQAWIKSDDGAKRYWPGTKTTPLQSM